MNEILVEVAPAVPINRTSRQTYTYRLPDKGEYGDSRYRLVRIMFGHRAVRGVIINGDRGNITSPIKTMESVGQTGLTEKQVAFARWLADVSGGGLGFTLRLFFPPREKLGKNSQRVEKYEGFKSARDQAGEIQRAIEKKNGVLIENNIARRKKVLLSVISNLASHGGQILTVVPERQLIDDGYGTHFSADLPAREINRVWHGVKDGSIKAVRGTQKALFLPFMNLKLIIVEEEQFASHKLWDQYPRLHNIDAAAAMSKIYQCPLLFTSSYPSLFVQRGLRDGTLVGFNHHPVKPQGRLIDYTFNDKLRSCFLPGYLKIKMDSWIKKRLSVLLFSNRRDSQALKSWLTNNWAKKWQAQVVISTSAIFADCQQRKFDRVVWLLPEQVLTYPDFRSCERARIVLARLQRFVSAREYVYLVSKRARLIESYLLSPFDKFADQELALRNRLLLPPYAHLVRLTIKAGRKDAYQVAVAARAEVDGLISKGKAKIVARGPFSDLGKKSRQLEQYLLLRGGLADLIALVRQIKKAEVELSPERIL